MLFAQNSSLPEQRTSFKAARTPSPPTPLDERFLHLASLAVLKDVETSAHMFRVGQTSCAMAWWVTGDVAYARHVCIGAPFHDIGKICVAPAVLGKPGPLSDAEMLEMRHHPEFGARLLQGGNDVTLEIASEIALHHHERLDGAGYPHGLKGDEIPLSARIVAVCDYFDALTRDRCYRPAVAEAEVVDSMMQLVGTKFDPVLVDMLARRLPELRTLAAAVDARAQLCGKRGIPRQLFEPLVI